MIGVKPKVWFLHEGLFAKYVVSLVGLVVFVLAVNGAIETFISYRATKASLTGAMSEKAEATAKRIDQSISELERQISWVTRASVNGLEQRRADYAQLMNQVAPISQLTWLNGQGRELLRLSRTQMAVSSGIDFSHDARFNETVARGVNVAPATFASDPGMSRISTSSSSVLGPVFASSRMCRRVSAFTTQKIAKPTMRKLMMELMNSPMFSVAAPACWASASES